MASWNAKWSWVVALLAMLVQLHFFTGVSSRNIKNTLFRKATRSINDRNLRESPDVVLNTERRRQVVMSNGLVEVTLSSPDGEVIGIKYNGIDNVLETDNAQDNRGYWDVVWYKPGEKDNIDKLEGTNFQVIMADKDQVEISFTKKWNYSRHVPLNVDKRYIMRRGVSGFYAYAILEREPGWPDVDMDQIRAVFKLQKDRFHYMAISDKRQRIMPMPEDRETGQPLAYPEAVLLTKPINTELKGEVDDKYQYSSENKDNKVQGWISANPPVGFWMITPSNEFLSSGPTKQDLTSHVGPTVLSMFTSIHYGGKDIDTKYRNGEPWKKVLGPVLVYLNQVSSTNNIYGDLWRDAKAQMWKEVESWPYDFLQSQDFPKSYQRGNISGQLQVFDRCINSRTTGAKYAYVGLAAPGQVGSWQTETKGYQFWTQTDEQGNFFLKNVREGDYDLYAWVPGFIGDYKHYTNIAVKAGSEFNLGAIVYRPPRNGPTLWEIGVPDRSAAEFFVPDPYPTLMNRLYKNDPANKFRQYGLWARYADIYGNNDLKYTIGISDHTRDWFFAHVTRDTGNRTYQPTTRQIMFELLNVNSRGDYTLQVAMAAASESEFQLRINDANVDKPDFSTGPMGRDNAIARHGIHGLYRFYSINIPSSKLYKGSNTFYLTQSRSQTPFQGILYDYIRLEGPPSPRTSSSQNVVG